MMIKTEFKFQGQIQNGSSYHVHKESQNFRSLLANLTLKAKVTSLQTCQSQIWKFEGQFDIEFQGHQF